MLRIQAFRLQNLCVYFGHKDCVKKYYVYSYSIYCIKNHVHNILYKDVMYTNFIIKIYFVANEQPRKDARLRGGSLMEPCAIVPGAD